MNIFILILKFKNTHPSYKRAFGPARAGYVTSFTALAGTLSASCVSLILPYVLKKLTVQMAEFYVILGCAR